MGRPGGTPGSPTASAGGRWTPSASRSCRGRSEPGDVLAISVRPWSSGSSQRSGGGARADHLPRTVAGRPDRRPEQRRRPLRRLGAGLTRGWHPRRGGRARRTLSDGRDLPGTRGRPGLAALSPRGAHPVPRPRPPGQPPRTGHRRRGRRPLPGPPTRPPASSSAGWSTGPGCRPSGRGQGGGTRWTAWMQGWPTPPGSRSTRWRCPKGRHWGAAFLARLVVRARVGLPGPGRLGPHGVAPSSPTRCGWPPRIAVTAGSATWPRAAYSVSVARGPQGRGRPSAAGRDDDGLHLSAPLRPGRRAEGPPPVLEREPAGTRRGPWGRVRIRPPGPSPVTPGGAGPPWPARRPRTRRSPGPSS